MYFHVFFQTEYKKGNFNLTKLHKIEPTKVATGAVLLKTCS